jgi:hypothetical protein
MYLLQGRIGFSMEIVKQIVEFVAKSVGLCRISMMTTCLLIPNCLIWGGGVPCLSYWKISTQCSILLS